MAKNTFSQSQVQQQAQIQALSPQQVLLARLLELTTVEVEDRVRGEVMENPVLEVVDNESVAGDYMVNDDGDVNSADDYLSADDIPDYNGWDYHDSSSPSADMQVGDVHSFGDTLVEQLSELQLTPQQQAIGEYLIGSLDDDGLLHKPLAEIEYELMLYASVTTSQSELETVLKMIQGFEPAGIAARSLQECLLLQLERNTERDCSLHCRIVNECYDDFTKKRWGAIPAKLQVGEQECRDAIADIVRLNPRPGAALAESVGVPQQQIVPDFNIDITGDEITVSLNNYYVPSLRVNSEYEEMLALQSRSDNAEQRAAAQFLKQKIDSAKGFISAIKQREETLMRSMQAIADAQRAFLLSGGDEAMLTPMILEDIATKVGYDISTISRVSNSKYVQLPWGIYPLKYFFSDGVAMVGGGECSVRELYCALQELVDAEDKQSPLTDTELMEKLQEQGFSLARRTVAKYREALHIPVARLRKE